ncbi:hypothetical protein RMSM_01701 [Rhodopirellula maiorica SM1]|uniref:Uncharacterized protein n=1 Tax=Rhodopirellula maiorica SM1 TaxID=1265738 RepID=M5RPV6_9BACT|nr:hypothetical protein RMSM_01701 [Rhodopirellula maiorica SM1]
MGAGQRRGFQENTSSARGETVAVESFGATIGLPIAIPRWQSTLH